MYAAIDQLVQGNGLAVTVVCHVLAVSRSGFYAWQQEREGVRVERDRERLPWIRDIFWRHKRRYGARRIAQELCSVNERRGVAHVARLLKTQGLRAIPPKSFRPRTTESRHRLGDNPNRLRDRAAPARIHEVGGGQATQAADR